MSEIAGITVCNLCGKRFAGPMTVAVGHHNGRLEWYLKKLVDHFNTEHVEQSRAIELRGLEYTGMLRMMNFKTGDAEIARQCDFLRWQIHQQTLYGRMSDENLTAATAELTAHLIDSVIAVMITAAEKHGGIDVPELVASTKAQLAEEIARQIRPEFEGLRNALEEPGKYQISRVLDPNTPAPPSKAPH
jgi:hypothetical protein